MSILQSVEHSQMKDPGGAGRVKRWHTWDMLTVQNDAEHQWGVARLVLAFSPDCRKEVLVEALMHDMGERVAGDLPHPIKSIRPEIRKPIEEVERMARLNMVIPWGLPAPQILTDDEHFLIKYCDLFEMLERSLLEIELGNRHAELIKLRCREFIGDMHPKLPEKIQDRAYSYLNRRLREHDNLMRGEVG